MKKIQPASVLPASVLLASVVIVVAIFSGKLESHDSTMPAASFAEVDPATSISLSSLSAPGPGQSDQRKDDTLVPAPVTLQFVAESSTMPVQPIIDCMRGNSCRNLLLRHELKNGDVTVVFRLAGVRYTFALSKTAAYGGAEWIDRLRVSARWDKTTDPKILDMWIDDFADGQVNMGMAEVGNEDPDDPHHYYFSDTDRYMIGGPQPKVEGAEFREYWQKRHDLAVAAATLQIL